jgi:tetratricopeptide (TPR) repeat protein
MSDTPASLTAAEQLAAEWAAALAEAERQVAEMEAAEQAGLVAPATSAAASPNSPPAPRRQIPVRLLMLVGIGSLMSGLIIGTIVQVVRSLSHPDADEFHSTKKFNLEAIDQLIRTGYNREALEALKSAEIPVEFDRGEIAYRRGICQELLGQFAEATEAYQEATKVNQPGWVRATLGRVRCAAAQGDTRSARELLDQVVLRSGQPDCQGWRTVAECLYLRARLSVLELQPPSQPAPSDQNTPAWAPFKSNAVEDLKPLNAVDSPGETTARTPLSLDANRNVSAHFSERSAAVVLHELAAAARQRIHFDDGCEENFAKRLISAEVKELPLAELLTVLARQTECGWRIEGNVIWVGRFRAPSAPDLLHHALEFAPVHPSAPAAQLALGNLHFLTARWDQARDGYKQLLHQHRDRPEAISAAYNLALVELRTGNPAAARHRFLEVIDRDDHGHWANLARQWLRQLPRDLRDNHPTKN